LASPCGQENKEDSNGTHPMCSLPKYDTFLHGVNILNFPLSSENLLEC
jgi:hypothetical protein